MHTAEETLVEAKKIYDGEEGRQLADKVSPTHPGEDNEWWVTDMFDNTFAVGTWDSDTTMTFRLYKP